MQPDRGEITLLLARWKDGEPSAFDELMPLVYPHLREVAAFCRLLCWCMSSTCDC